MRLTDRTVTNSKPELPEGKTDAIFFDDAISGFGLRVREGGSRVWIYQPRRAYQADDAWLDVEDRRGQSQLAAKVALGLDPAAEKQEAQAHKETLGEAVTAYLKVKVRELKPPTYIETERYLEETARGLHGRPLVDITQAEIADLLNKTRPPTASAPI